MTEKNTSREGKYRDGEISQVEIECLYFSMIKLNRRKSMATTLNLNLNVQKYCFEQITFGLVLTASEISTSSAHFYVNVVCVVVGYGNVVWEMWRCSDKSKLLDEYDENCCSKKSLRLRHAVNECVSHQQHSTKAKAQKRVLDMIPSRALCFHQREINQKFAFLEINEIPNIDN